MPSIFQSKFLGSIAWFCFQRSQFHLDLQRRWNFRIRASWHLCNKRNWESPISRVTLLLPPWCPMKWVLHCFQRRASDTAMRPPHHLSQKLSFLLCDVDWKVPAHQFCISASVILKTRRRVGPRTLRTNSQLLWERFQTDTFWHKLEVTNMESSICAQWNFFQGSKAHPFLLARAICHSGAP